MAYTYDTLGNLLKQSGPTKGEEDTYQYNDLNQMVSKHVCGYEQKLTRIYDYGYTYDKRGNLVKEEEICSPTTTGPKNITIATYLYDETNRMVQGTNKAGEVSAYTFNGLGVRVGTELILKDNTHGYTDFHCQTPSVETGIEKPEVVKTDYVIDYTRLDIDQRVLMKSEQDGYDFFYTYGLDKLQVMTIGEGSNWWGQSIKKCVNMAYVHTDRLGSVVNLSDQYGRVTARADYTDWGEVRRYTDITVDGGFRRLLPEITYATHEYDDVLNQFYAKARMYDAENKRFAAVDPVKGSITTPISMVQYLYVVNNPNKWVDPLGLIKFNGRDITTAIIGRDIASSAGSATYMHLDEALNLLRHENTTFNIIQRANYRNTSHVLSVTRKSKYSALSETRYISLLQSPSGNYFVKLSCVESAYQFISGKMATVSERSKNVFDSSLYTASKAVARANNQLDTLLNTGRHLTSFKEVYWGGGYFVYYHSNTALSKAEFNANMARSKYLYDEFELKKLLDLPSLVENSITGRDLDEPWADSFVIEGRFPTPEDVPGMIVALISYGLGELHSLLFDKRNHEIAYSATKEYSVPS